MTRDGDGLPDLANRLTTGLCGVLDGTSVRGPDQLLVRLGMGSEDLESRRRAVEIIVSDTIGTTIAWLVDGGVLSPGQARGAGELRPWDFDEYFLALLSLDTRKWVAEAEPKLLRRATAAVLQLLPSATTPLAQRVAEVLGSGEGDRSARRRLRRELTDRQRPLLVEFGFGAPGSPSYWEARLLETYILSIEDDAYFALTHALFSAMASSGLSPSEVNDAIRGVARTAG